eukprot:345955-Rhodomonas_salina.2
MAVACTGKQKKFCTEKRTSLVAIDGWTNSKIYYQRLLVLIHASKTDLSQAGYGAVIPPPAPPCPLG